MSHPGSYEGSRLSVTLKQEQTRTRWSRLMTLRSRVRPATVRPLDHHCSTEADKHEEGRRVGDLEFVLNDSLSPSASSCTNNARRVQSLNHNFVW